MRQKISGTISISGKFSVMGGGTEKGKTNLGYCYTILIEAGVFFYF